MYLERTCPEGCDCIYRQCGLDDDYICPDQVYKIRDTADESPRVVNVDLQVNIDKY